MAKHHKVSKAAHVKKAKGGKRRHRKGSAKKSAIKA
jgi:hypothetical protein